MFMHKKNQRGAALVLFAVMVPVLIAMMSLVFDLGQLYFKHTEARNIAESIEQIAEKILIKPDLSYKPNTVEDIPSTAIKYNTYEDLKNAYPKISEDLTKMHNRISDLKAELESEGLEDIIITEIFAVGTTTEDKDDFYYQVTVTNAYNQIIKLSMATTSVAYAEESTPAATTTKDSSTTYKITTRFSANKHIITSETKEEREAREQAEREEAERKASEAAQKEATYDLSSTDEDAKDEAEEVAKDANTVTYNNAPNSSQAREQTWFGLGTDFGTDLVLNVVYNKQTDEKGTNNKMEFDIDNQNKILLQKYVQYENWSWGSYHDKIGEAPTQINIGKSLEKRNSTDPVYITAEDDITKPITLNLTKSNSPNHKRPIIFTYSGTANINLNVNINTEFYGMIYAPNAKVILTGSGVIYDSIFIVGNTSSSSLDTTGFSGKFVKAAEGTTTLKKKISDLASKTGN